MNIFSVESNRVAGVVLAGALACTPSEGTSTGSESAGSTSQGGTTQAGGSSGSGGTTAAGSSGQAETGQAETGAPTSGGSSGGSSGGAAGPSFTEVYEKVLVPQGCTAGYCHGGMSGGLVMTDEATAYANLVDVAATMAACGLTLRVVPGAPDESILWMRVRPSALDMGNPCVSKMPEGMPGLPDADAQLVNEWIVGGALE